MSNQRITFVDLQLPSAHMDISHRIAKEPIGILEMGAFLKIEKGIDVSYIIIESQQSSVDSIIKTNPDIVGFSTYTYNYNFAVKLAKEIKSSSSRIKVVLGGPHAGMIPKQVAQENPNIIDAIISGEGEGGMLSFLEGQQGIIKSDHISLDRIPLADRIETLFPNSNMALFNHKTRRIAVVITSRGCYNTCDFCIDRMSGYRMKPIKNVVDEIKYLVNQRSIDTILFEDPLINGDVNRLEKLCDALIQLRNLGGIKDYCALSMIGFNLGDNPEILLKKMSLAGFVQLNWGIEDPRQEYRNYLNKGGGSVKSKILEISNKYNIKNRALLMLPTNINTEDPEKDVIEYTKTLISLPLDEIKINITTPYPGTPFYERLLANGKIKDYNWDHYDTHNLVFDAGNWDQSKLDIARDYITTEFNKSRQKNISKDI